jgi:hypothetical protein
MQIDASGRQANVSPELFEVMPRRCEYAPIEISRTMALAQSIAQIVQFARPNVRIYDARS